MERLSALYTRAMLADSSRLRLKHSENPELGKERGANASAKWNISPQALSLEDVEAPSSGPCPFKPPIHRGGLTPTAD